MSDTKFTPGPWQTDRENVHTGCVATCHGDKDSWFEVWSENWSDGIDQEANANLIAAAPEMYEALEELVEQLEGEYFSFEAARKALAKARGEV